MTGHLVRSGSILAAVAMIAIVGSISPARSDDEEERPVTSGAARVSEDATGRAVITIGPAAQRDIGLATEVLALVVRPVVVEAYGFILDPAALSRLNADLSSAQAQLEASSADYQRTKRLFSERKNASLHDLQSTRAAYLTDKARTEALEQQLRDSWGQAFAELTPPARSRLIAGLVDRREAVAQVTVPAGREIAVRPRSAQVLVLGHERQPLRTRAVYEGPAVERKMQGRTFLLLLDTKAVSLRPGMAVSARLPRSGTAERGVMIPRAAVVRYAGAEWVYSETGGDRFARRKIAPAERTGKGYFVVGSVAPGTRIVVTGAQALLSEELKARIQMEH